MAPMYTLIVTALLGSAAVTVGHTTVPTPTTTDVQRRADASDTSAIPTFTFDAVAHYLSKRDANAGSDPEPSGDKLQIYPTGFYTDFPKEGVTLAFGPDLKMKIKDALGSDCAEKPDECRDRLLPILRNTDVGTHAKRFVIIAIGLALLVELVVAELFILSVETAYLAMEEKPTVVYHLPYNDLNQIHQIDYSDEIAFQYGVTGSPKTITVPGPTEATPTGKEVITLETITADAGERKKGDIVYHIPKDSASRIQDFLAMIGVGQVVDACQGHDLFNLQASRLRRHSKRADTLEHCIGQIAAMTPDFLDSVPAQALQLAAEVFPAPVGPGQTIGYPVPSMRNSAGEFVITGIYHVYYMHRRAATPAPAPGAPQFDMPTLVKSALGLTILTHVVMHAGQVGMEIWMPQSAVKTDINEDELTCPDEILCFDDACGAQAFTAIPAQYAWCKTEKNWGCRCQRVHYPHYTYVEEGYMEEQYEYTQELVRLYEGTSFDAQCDGDVQALSSAADIMRSAIKGMCKKHEGNFQDDTTTTESNGDMYWNEEVYIPDAAVKLHFYFKRSLSDAPATCGFDCETVFNAFADSQNCIKDSGMVKNGMIKEDCGQMGFNVYGQ